jgi:hypothetical protein
MVIYQAFPGYGIGTRHLTGTGKLICKDKGSVCSLLEMTKSGNVDMVSPKGTKRKYVEYGEGSGSGKG